MSLWIRLGGPVLGVLGCVGASLLMACASQQARVSAPREETPAVAVSSGGGGAATVDTGQFPTGNEGTDALGAQRAFHDQVARELGWRRSTPEAAREGTGGSGGEAHVCAQALDAREPVTLVSGIINFRSEGLVVLDVAGKGPVKLRTDGVTCAVQAGKAIAPASLSEGTEARVSYVEEPGGATARVIRAEPMRPQR